MNPLKRLAGQTAIYGLPTIVGRLLNYFLVPLYTRVLGTAEYGTVAEMYTYVTFLNVIFTYGMETAYFRFCQTESDKGKVYFTNLFSILSTSIVLAAGLVLFAAPLATSISHSGHKDYIITFALMLGLDAITSIPFAKLRLDNRPKKYAIIKSINIGVNILLNLFFLLFCPWVMKSPDHIFYGFVSGFFNRADFVEYVFLANLAASALTLVLLIPQFPRGGGWKFDLLLWKRMMYYALPLLIVGLAGMVNETSDRLMIKYLTVDKSIAMSEVGIYSACYKIAIFMTIFIQTVRMAAEPFFFVEAQKSDSRKTYATVMKYFVIACSLIFIGVMMNMYAVQYFVGVKFRSGLKIVPVLLVANLCLGIYYNLSIWYKLSGQTRYGAWLALAGAGVTLLLNFILIPIMGYMGAAWTTLACYFFMMVVSYLIGQVYFPVPYNLKKMIFYPVLAISIYALMTGLWTLISPSPVVELVTGNLALLLFVSIAWVIERPQKTLSSLP